MKNAICYSVIMPNVDNMRQAIIDSNNYARKPSDVETVTLGWSVHSVTGVTVSEFEGGYALVATLWEKKIKPSVIRQLVNEQCDLFDYPVKKRERDEIRDEILSKLTLTTPPERKNIVAYYLTDACQLIVDTASENDANVVTNLIRQTLGSLKSTTLHVDMVNGLSRHISDYLTNPNQQFLPPFNLGGDIKLVDLNGANVTYKNLNLTDEGTANEIVSMIDEAFMTVKSVEMVSNDESFSFTLTDGFKFKSIKWEDIDGEWSDDATMQTYTISRLVNQLVSRFDNVGDGE